MMDMVKKVAAVAETIPAGTTVQPRHRRHLQPSNRRLSLTESWICRRPSLRRATSPPFSCRWSVPSADWILAL